MGSVVSLFNVDLPPDLGARVGWQGDEYVVTGWLCARLPPEQDGSELAEVELTLYEGQREFHGMKLEFCARGDAVCLLATRGGEPKAVIPVDQAEVLSPSNSQSIPPEMHDARARFAASLVGQPFEG